MLASSISLLSLVAGTSVCNARCPFCISRMTPLVSLNKRAQKINHRNLKKALLLASRSGTTTAMITGKGEPLLYPEHISTYLEALKDVPIPLIELQTNAIPLADSPERYSSYFRDWYELGLNTVAISVVHYRNEINRSVYLPHRPKYPALERTVEYLHKAGMTVRLACVMCSGMIDSPEEVIALAKFAKTNGISQISLREVNSPNDALDRSARDWVASNCISKQKLTAISDELNAKATILSQLPHGAVVYDLEGQNICLTNSLTNSKDSKNLRQLIFFPDGTITYDWQHQGSVLIKGEAA